MSPLGTTTIRSVCRRLVCEIRQLWSMTPDPVVRRVARTIRSIRLKQKLSQEAYAERAEVHRNYVGLVERGERAPSVRNLIKLAKGLGMKASDLLRAASL